MRKEKEGSVTRGLAEKLGVTVAKEGIHFALFLPAEKECRLNLYDRDSVRQLMSVRLTEENRRGNVFTAFLKHKQLRKLFNDQEDWEKRLGYLYETKQGEFTDPCGALLYGREKFGRKKGERGRLLCGIYHPSYDWGEEVPIRRPFQETILYKLHIRGFTMDESSGVSSPGTFRGAAEKIPYLKELGITACLLMPAYEFEESMEEKGITDRINYWGYSHSNSYFAPKAAYAHCTEEPDRELKDMVKAFHQNGIEVLMEMNFLPGTNTFVAWECLRHWVQEYHVDGFKLSNGAVPVSVLSTDPLLGNVKFLSEGWDFKVAPEKGKTFINFGECSQNFSDTGRRFIRGDEEQVREFARQFTALSEDFGTVKYITSHDGFTLWDLFSYDKKHNEANGENNRDGQDYNYSCNCGKEGKTGRKAIISLRRKQARNAMAILLLSQGTPVLLAGDEFLNSQEGNNNPYCQDNRISWLNWERLEEERDFFFWVKSLISIRKEHPVFSRKEPFRQMDYISCGMPDLSFHGTAPWYADYNHYSRQLGILLCGAYVGKDRNSFDNSFYLAFNFHWEEAEFHLPDTRKGEEWELFLSTPDNYCEPVEGREEALKMQLKDFYLPAKSIMVFISRKVNE